MDFNNRVKFYLGSEKFTEKEKIYIKKLLIYYNTDSFINYNNLNIKYYKKGHDLIHNDHHHEKLYTKPLFQVLQVNNKLNIPFFMSVGDLYNETITKPIKIPVLTKNRIIDNDEDCSTILRCLNFQRHWKLYYNPPKDMPFEKKSDILYWRGVTTGTPEKPANRFDLVKKWFDKKNYIDIGFTEIVQNKHNYYMYVKGRNVDPSEFLKHKYLLSVEGNDKDSGLNWKLNSNSIVLMAKPRSISWLMESKLIPGYHYILLKDDFSDLDEKIIWCHNNPLLCKKIIYNANNYMKQFSNPFIENLIENMVIKKYFKKLEF